MAQKQSNQGKSTLDRVMADVDRYTKYAKPTLAKAEKAWKLWSNKRVRKQYHGTSDSFDPMTFQVVESTVDNVYGSRPQLTFIPTRVEQEVDTKILNAHWDICWDASNMDAEIIPIGRENELGGNNVVFVGWADGLMTITHVPFGDCILDSSARTPGEMKFAGYRRLAMIEDLKKEKRYDPLAGELDENGEPAGAWVPRYTGLSGLGEWPSGGDSKTVKQQKDAMKGSLLEGDDQKGQIEVIYMAYLDYIIEIGNRRKVIAKYPTPFQKAATPVTARAHNEDGEKLFDDEKLPPEADFMDEQELADSLEPAQTQIDAPEIAPFLPVAMHRGFVDPGLLLAKGTVEMFADVQEDLNDALNEKKDNIAFQVQNVALVDDQQAGDLIPRLAKAKPGSMVRAKGIARGENPVQWVDKPDMTGASDLEMQRAKQSIRDTSRVDQVVQGVSSENNRTATEVNAQVAGATSGFGTKTRNLEAGFYKQLGELYWKMVQIFLTEPQLVRVVGKDGANFQKFDPSKFWGPYDVKVVLDIEAKAKQKEEAEKALEVLKLFGNDPAFNQVALKKMVARKALGMDDDDIALLMNPDPMNGAMAGGVMGGDVMPGSPTPPPALPPETVTEGQIVG